MSEASFAGCEGSIFYRRWAPQGEPRALVLLAHGYGEHSGRYEHVAAALNRIGAVVYACDHLGHGRSEGARARIEDFEHLVLDLHELAEIARAAHPRLSFVLVGHSMGGLLAVRYAQRYGKELAGLALSGAAIGDWGAARALLDAPEIPDLPIDPDTLSRDPEVGRAYASDPLVYHGPFQRVTLESLVRALGQARDEADRIGMPLLYVHGDADALVPVDASLQAAESFPAPDRTVRVYPGARHEVFNETNRDEVIAELTRFVSRVAGS
jgi:alpha-beta hydrolase superfamily lysophospholipase